MMTEDPLLREIISMCVNFNGKCKCHGLDGES